MPADQSAPVPRRRRISFVVATLVVLGTVIVGGVLLYRNANNPRHLFARATEAFAKKDIRTVRHLAVSLSDHAGFESHCHLLWGIVAIEGQRPQEALAELAKAMDHVDTRVLAATMMGEVHYGLNRLLDAERFLLRAIDEDPKAIDARRWLSAVYYDLGAFDLAVDQLLKISELDSTDYRPHRLLGLIEKDFEKYQAAVNNYEEALRRGVSAELRQEITVEMAECLVETRQFEKALSALETIDETDVVAMRLRALCLESSGQPEAAITWLDRALSSNPNDLSAAILRGRFSLNRGDATETIRVLGPLRSSYPNDYELHFLLAQAYERSGNADQATVMRDRAADLRAKRERFSRLHIEANDDPYNAELRYQLGIAAKEFGRQDLAVTWLRAALSLQPTHDAANAALRELLLSQSVPSDPP